ncbi:MAG: hypothetical protein V4732_11245 [Pseudomonadota bacterium]
MALCDRNFNLPHRMLYELEKSIICVNLIRNDSPEKAELCKFGINQEATGEKR